MCQAMGRIFTSVILGGAGTVTLPGGKAAIMEGEITLGSVDNLGEALRAAKNGILVPGYGLVVAQAQVNPTRYIACLCDGCGLVRHRD